MEILQSVLLLIAADLIFGGDNAVVIALATKKLDPKLRRKASLLGAGVAILLRIVFVILILTLGELHLPLINLIGGILLIYIALQLLGSQDDEVDVKEEKSLAKVVKTIVLADAIMSLDNAIVIAVIAANSGLNPVGEITLVVIALLFSFPIILFGASLISKLIEKYKFIIYLGSFILIHAALHMILKEPLLASIEHFLVEYSLVNYVVWGLSLLIVIIKLVLENKKEAK